MTNLQAIFSDEELDSLVNKHPARLAQMLRTPDCVPELMELIMQAEVTEHCGIPQKHSKTKCKRWGSNPRSVFWNGTRTPIQVPRVRNTETKKGSAVGNLYAFSCEELRLYTQPDAECAVWIVPT